MNRDSQRTPPPGRGTGPPSEAKAAPTPAAKPGAASLAERRAAALRENLHRRKRQQRLRNADPD